MNEDVAITLELQGLTNEDGHLRLEDLTSQLTALRKSLEGIDRGFDPDGRAGLYYRVVGLSHNSPVSVKLIPVRRPKRKEKDVDISERHHRIFKELESITRNEPPSPEVDNATLEEIRKLTSKNRSGGARLINNAHSVSFDDAFKKNLSYFLEHEEYSVGSIQGRLEAINLHGKNRFWIYPSAGPIRILCEFVAGLKEKAKHSLDKAIWVRGQKYFRPNANFPHRMVVHDFHEIETTEGIEKLIKMKGCAKSDEGSVQMIRRQRNAWSK